MYDIEQMRFDKNKSGRSNQRIRMTVSRSADRRKYHRKVVVPVCMRDKHSEERDDHHPHERTELWLHPPAKMNKIK